MKKVAVFGNTGGGKSTLSKQLSEVTGLPLVCLDKIKYEAGGKEIPHEIYLKRHSKILVEDQWVIDGFGCVPSAWERFSVADTLVYIDLPFRTHFLWVTKRFLKGLFVNPEGWPDKSPLIKCTINSYKVLWLCHQRLTPRYRKLVEEIKGKKQVFHLTSPKSIEMFLNDIGNQ